MSTLAHITLTTGHTRQSPRSEVGDDVVRLLRGLLARADGARIPVPNLSAYQWQTTREGALSLTTLWAVSDGAPVLTFGVAAVASEADALQLWALLAKPEDKAGDRPPPAPWCAVALEVGAILHPDALEWSGDFERCVAWALLEPGRIRGHHLPLGGHCRTAPAHSRRRR